MPVRTESLSKSRSIAPEYLEVGGQINQSKYAHSTLTMAMEVDRLSEKVKELTDQNVELESTIMYHLKTMDEANSESAALHAILKIIKSYPDYRVSDLLPSITEALLASGCNELAGVTSRLDHRPPEPIQRSSSQRSAHNAEQLDVLVDLILNGQRSIA